MAWRDDAILDALRRAGFVQGDGAWVTQRDQHRVRCTLGKGSASRIEELRLSLPVQRRAEAGPYRGDGATAPRPVRIVVRERRARDTFGVRLGLNRAVLTDDPAVYVEAARSEESAATEILASPGLGDSLGALLEAGASEVRLGARVGRLTAVLPIGASTPEAGAIEEMVTQLVSAHACLPHFSESTGPEPARPGPASWLSLGLGIAAAGTLALTGDVSLRALREAAADPRTLAGGFGLSLGVVGAVYLACRGSSTGLRRFALVAIPGVALAIAASVHLALRLR